MAEEELKPKEKLTIIIKLPRDLQDRLLAFPAIHLIRDAYPDDDLHFICDVDSIEMLNALPIKAFYHEMEEDEIKSLFDVHRYVTLGKITRADHYYNFDKGFNSAILGYFLGAKKRIGFNESWWASWVYTLAVPVPVGFNLTEKLFLLFKESTHLKIPEEFKIKGKDFTPFYPEETPPYIVIDLYPFRIGAIDEFWRTFFNLYEDKTFVLFCSKDIEKGGLLIQSLIPQLSTKNKYFHFVNTNWIDLGKVITTSKGFVGRNTAAAKFSAYLGKETIIIYEEGNPKDDAPFFFYANWQLMDLSDPTLCDKKKDGLFKERLQVDPFVLFERSIEAFRF